MIIELRAKNCYAFEDEITFSMKADMRNKKFGTNVKVSFRAYNDMLDMMEVNDMSLEEMASLEEGEENE